MYPAPYVRLGPQGGMEFEGAGLKPEKPKFEKDFIMLSEFSELVGPIPVRIIPDDKAKGNFNANHFAVRVMSSDFQTTSGKVVGEDSQVFLSEKQDSAYAYVHYFSLNDIHARGYVRQYCICYVTASQRKIIENFNELLKQISVVTAMLKVSNHKLFQRDLNRHFADLELTMKLLKEEGWAEDSKPCADQLYTEFDFAKEDVPERDPTQVTNAMQETQEILAVIRERLETQECKEALEGMEKMRAQYRQQKYWERERVGSTATATTSTTHDYGTSRGESGFTSYLPQPISQDSGARWFTESLSSSDSSEYEPQRVMTHLVHKFERRLRPLEELSPQAHSVAIGKLNEICKHFSRSELVLEMEKEEAMILDPYSSLLTIGRVPVLNMLQDPSTVDPGPPPPYTECDNSRASQGSYQRRISSVANILFAPATYRLSSRSTWGMPNQYPENCVVQNDSQAKSGFDTSFLNDRVGLKHFLLYVDSTFTFRSDSFAISEPPDYEHALTLSGGSHLDTDSDSNLLEVQRDDEDDRGSRSSTNFATPETGLTPKSSDEEVEGANRVKIMEEHGGEERSQSGSNYKNGNGNHDDVMDAGQNQFLDVPHRHVGVVSNCHNKTGSLERSANSSPYLFSESGSQCTLTDSKEDKPVPLADDSRDTQVQATNIFGQTGLVNGRGSDGCGAKQLPTQNGFEETDGAGVSQHQRQQQQQQRQQHSVSINSSSQWGEIVTFAGIEANGGPGINEGQASFHRADKYEEGCSVGSGRFKGEGNLVLTKDLMVSHLTGGQHHHHQLRPSPGSSVGTTSNTSDEQPLSSTSDEKAEQGGGAAGGGGGGGGGGGITRLGWARTKNKNVAYPPSDLKLKRDQNSPDTYFTPTAATPSGMSFASNSTRPPSHNRFSVPSHERATGGYNVPSHPLSPGQQSVTSLETALSELSFYGGPTMAEVRGMTNLPLVSTIDHIEGAYKFKPGKGINNLCKTTPILMDLLYCLLQGRTLILLGKPSDENLIRRLIRVLWLFVPGHSCQRQVITWQEAPLDIRDLSRVKLIGLSNKISNSLGAHLKQYVSYWDCSTGKLYTPSYNGELLKPIVSRTKDKKNEEVFLTHIHSVLLEIAMKAFVYYHGYCTAIPEEKRSPPFAHPRLVHASVIEKSTVKRRKMSFLQKLGVKNDDVDIIEYFVDMIREQQLVEWGLASPNGGPHDDNPVRIQLQTKHCPETFSKPKRPY